MSLDLHVSLSRASGNTRGDEDKSMEATMRWFAITFAFLFPTALHENVPGFDKRILEDLLGEYYDIHECPMHPQDFGIPSRRPRTYRLLVAKQCCTNVLFPFNKVPEFSGPTACADYQIFLIASEEELLEELRWASSRPTSKAQTLVVTRPLDRGAFRCALTETEENNLKDYERLFPKNAKGVFSLNQMAAAGRGVLSSDWELQCIVKNAHMLWDNSAARWCTGREVLASQVFPAFGTDRLSVPLCNSYQVDRPHTRTRGAIIERAGNTMNVSIAGYVHIYRLLCIELVGDSAAASAGRMAKRQKLLNC